VIIADYHLPEFDAPSALRIVQRTGKDIPFVVVSGAIGEDVAVGMMKAGAHDYVLKDRLERLAPAVDREIREAGIRKQHRQAEDERNAAFAELAAIHSNTPALLFVVNAQLRVEKLNNRATRLSGRTPHELTGNTLDAVLGCASGSGGPCSCGSQPNCDSCIIVSSALDTIQNGTKHESIEVWKSVSVGADRENRAFLFSIAPLILGQNRKALICGQDVTAQKRTQVALQETVNRLEMALVDKAVLFQEVHHRVKNNLQIIASLLSMQARTIKNAKSAGELKDTEERVRAMAMVHEQLYSQKEISSVDLAAYISKLAPRLVSSHRRSESIALRLELTPTWLTLERSIPCGLILTEFVTNALKYAYPEGKGEILVRLSSHPSTIQLSVSDSGVGLPDDFDWKSTNSLGMVIVQALARQLAGGVEIGPPPGCIFTLRFPKEPEDDARPNTPHEQSESVGSHEQNNVSQVVPW
jgi:two-component sensor histidine kinase